MFDYRVFDRNVLDAPIDYVEVPRDRIRFWEPPLRFRNIRRTGRR